MTTHLQALASAFGAEITDHLEREEKTTTGRHPTHYTLIGDDPVNHPKHYTSHPSGVECIEITEHMIFNLGNATKYIWRADSKSHPIEDIEKAIWYLNREIERRKAMDE